MKKSLRRFQRLQSAVQWIKTYTGKNLVKGYAKRYAVDKLCAVKELRMIGVEISGEYEKQLRRTLQGLWDQRRLRKQKRDEQVQGNAFDSDEYFALIIGYTSGGAAFGVTHEQMAEWNAGSHYVDDIDVPPLCAEDEPPEVEW